MKDALLRYYFKPACWWQFWLPQSGLFGGLLGAAIIITTFFILR